MTNTLKGPADENRSFKIHPRLIFDVICRQQGQFQRAVVEGVTNSLDAAATRCDVVIDNRTFRISDDGRGFEGRKQIEEFFETFGTPHNEGDSIIGRYRMGRGQLFAFARTKWRTGAFWMDVDIRDRGLDYSLRETPDDVAPGCTIVGELYERLTPSDLDNVCREFKTLVAYSLIPVTLNGKLMSEEPGATKWDYEDEFCKIKLRKTGGVKVYNLGYFVREYPAHQFGGIGAIIVSKKVLQVTFARNDILQSECKVWKSIRKTLDTLGGQKVNSKAERLNNEQRAWLCQQFATGAISLDEFRDKKVFRKAPSQWVGLQAILDCDYRKRPLVVLERGDNDRLAEVVNRNDLALVLTPEVLEWFGVESAGDLLASLRAAVASSADFRSRYMVECFDRIKVKTLAEVSKGMSAKNRLVEPKDYSDLESTAMTVLTDLGWRVTNMVADNSAQQRRPRKLVIGVSDSAVAWTNGQTYIAFERAHLARMLSSFEGVGELVGTYIHEYLHDDDDSGSHQHDEEFFRDFHDLMLNGETNVFGLQREFIRRFYLRCKKKEIAVPSALRRSLDTFFNLSNLEAEGDEQPPPPAA